MLKTYRRLLTIVYINTNRYNSVYLYRDHITHILYDYVNLHLIILCKCCWNRVVNFFGRRGFVIGYLSYQNKKHNIPYKELTIYAINNKKCEKKIKLT